MKRHVIAALGTLALWGAEAPCASLAFDKPAFSFAFVERDAYAKGTVTLDAPVCGSSGNSIVPAVVTATINGEPAYAEVSSVRECVGTATFYVPVYQLMYGDYRVVVRSGSAPPVSADVTIRPHFELSSPSGAPVQLSVFDPGYLFARGRCNTGNVRSGALGDPGMPPFGPPGVDLPLGLVHFELRGCDWTPPFNDLNPTPPTLHQSVFLSSNEELPARSVVWAYGPTADDPKPHWTELKTSLAGRYARFQVVDGALADDALGEDKEIHATVAIGVPRYAAVPGRFQDIWWAGPQENGWGLGITQHRDTLFGILFVYDAKGDARWLVIPSGLWNDERTVYTGEVYRPRGHGIFEPGPWSFDIGPPVGIASYDLTGPDTLTLRYTIDGISAERPLSRLMFGPQDPFPDVRFDDLWWSGLQYNGWGLMIMQQYRSLFALWFTYDSNGDATWLAMPASDPDMNQLHQYAGNVYRPKGSPWLGAPYDSSKHAMTPAGRFSMQLRFGESRYGLFLYEPPTGELRGLSLEVVPF